MSCDKTTQEWHLTPKGWIEGTLKVYSKVESEVEPPIDRVETWEEKMVQSYSFSPEEISWRQIWISPDYTSQQRKELHAKYPKQGL